MYCKLVKALPRRVYLETVGRNSSSNENKHSRCSAARVFISVPYSYTHRVVSGLMKPFLKVHIKRSYSTPYCSSTVHPTHNSSPYSCFPFCNYTYTQNRCIDGTVHMSVRAMTHLTITGMCSINKKGFSALFLVVPCPLGIRSPLPLHFFRPF